MCKINYRGELEITSLNEAYLKDDNLIVELFDKNFTWLDLKYFINEKGNGEKVDEQKTILTHYAVYFEDGTLLDTSILKVAEAYNKVMLRERALEDIIQLKQELGLRI